MKETDDHTALKSCLKHLRYAIAEASDLPNDPATQSALDSIKDAASVVASRVDVFNARAKMAKDVRDALRDAEASGSYEDIVRYYKLRRAAEAGATAFSEIPDDELVGMIRRFNIYRPILGTLHGDEFVSACDRKGLFTHVKMTFMDGAADVIAIDPWGSFNTRVDDLTKARTEAEKANNASTVPASTEPESD